MSGDSRTGSAGWVRPSALSLALIGWLLALTYHHRWVMDDATIYFRYIDNWLFLDRGLVFNAGEYVEGYTSPLWLLLLAVARTSSLDFWTLSLALGLGCALLSALTCLALGRRLAPGMPSANLPLALLAGHYGVQTHFTSGLETPLVQLSGVLTALFVVQPHLRWLQLALGLMPLVRPELALIVVACALLHGLRLRALPWPLILSALVSGGAWLAFRIYYYADLLPNTFYLKAESNWAQGLRYLALELIGAWGALLSAIAVAIVAWVRARRQAKGEQQSGAPRLQMLALAALAMVWTVRIGGDMSYHRFFAFPFALAACATAGLLERATLACSAWRRNVALLVCFALTVASYPPQVLGAHPLVPGAKSLQWRGIEDAIWHRRHSDLRYGPERTAEDAALRRAYAEATDPGHHRRYAIKAFCEWAFVRPDVHVIHTYGLTDAILARVETSTRRPGHRNLWFQANDLWQATQSVPRQARGRSVYRLAVERGRAAPWIRRALPVIDRIQRKVHNRHDFLDNLTMALSPVPRIAPTFESL